MPAIQFLPLLESFSALDHIYVLCEKTMCGNVETLWGERYQRIGFVIETETAERYLLEFSNL